MRHYGKLDVNLDMRHYVKLDVNLDMRLDMNSFSGFDSLLYYFKKAGIMLKVQSVWFSP